MNSDEFLKELQYKLRGLPDTERVNAVRFFEEYIHKANLSPGTDVTTICGTPEEAARQVMSGSIDTRSIKKSVRAHETKSQREGRHNGIIGILVVLGILIIGAAALFGVFGLALDLSHFRLFKASKRETGTITLEDFRSLDVKTDAAAIELVSDSDSYYVDYSLINDDIKIDNKDGRLTLEHKNHNLFGFNLGDDSFIKVHVPKGASFDDIKLTGDTGAVKMKDISCSTAWLEADTGTVTLENSTTGDATLTTDTGAVHVTNSTVEKSLNAEADTGSIKLIDSTLNDIVVDTDTGSFHVNGTDFNTIEANLDTGSINIEAPGSRDDYSLELETDTGSVKINGSKEGKSLDQKGDTNKSIKAETDTGSVIIDFQ